MTVFHKAIHTLLIVLLYAIALSAGCGNQASDISEDETANVIANESRPKKELLASDAPGESAESESSQDRTIQSTLPATAQKTEFPQDKSAVEVDWGREINLDEMMTLAMKGQIVEIQWHVMPNILRAQVSDGAVFHLRNENKGVDLRNTLLKAGIKIGKGGVLFRHVFWQWKGPGE